MNNLLKLHGKKFDQKKRKTGYSDINLNKVQRVTLDHLKKLSLDLKVVEDFWKNHHTIDGVLVTVYYNDIIAKTNRIAGYFYDGKLEPNDRIVGVKYDTNKAKHIITYYLSKDLLSESIQFLNNVITTYENEFGDVELTYKNFKSNIDKIDFENSSFKNKKIRFKKYLKDSSVIESFKVEKAVINQHQKSIITFYNIDENIKKILKDINIFVEDDRFLSSNVVLLDNKELEVVFSKIPYLISMQVEDFSKFSLDNSQSSYHNTLMNIPKPLNEPTIGVIDTLFDERVYFSEWVEYHDYIADDIPKSEDDYRHGTAVSSLIVDAPSLNPHLDDGCGRFKVRHFGVALHSGFNSFTIIQSIREIVSQNSDIKVWNLSLGSNQEIDENYISIEGSVLDEIQYEYDVIFVIAGTNNNERTEKCVGAPADSLNGVVVNSVDFSGQVPNYSRKGPALSFFIKPDISYYGGSKDRFIIVCEPLGGVPVAGTSYATPLIARKLAYLIHIIGLNKEEAKAVLIDSAINWDSDPDYNDLIWKGYGVVPIKIQDILSTKNDEIKFVVSDISEAYDTFDYSFPIPVHNERYPYVAKSVMCYTPKCSRNQGVDYTNTELSLTFGRIQLKDGKMSIKNIKTNTVDNLPTYMKEKSAREVFRKWDNVKVIKEKFSQYSRSKKMLNTENPLWGMSIKTMERLKLGDGNGIRFGVVVTLKEINGVNRIDDFIQQAKLRGWIVDQIDIHHQIDLYDTKMEDINFE